MPEERNQAAVANQIVNCTAYADGKKVGAVDLADISTVLRVPGPFVWIGVREPGEELLRKLQAEFGLHDLAVEDAFRAHQRPKVEEYGDELFVVLRTAQLVDAKIAFGETNLFAGERYVVSVRHGASLSYADVRAHCESTPQLLRKGPGFVLYAIMDFVVDQYFPIVDDLEDQLEALEEEIFSDAFTSGTTERIYNLKRDLVGLKRAVSPLVDVCNRLVRFDRALIPEDTRIYFRDVYDHVIRINETVDNMRELLTTALEANLSLIAVRQNDVMKKLAAWAAILAVPTAVAGIYGMNFDWMPELHFTYSYPIALAAMAAACVFLHWRFKRAGWL
ncbi:MAG: magnesium/cobalt transporter CorA [Deltaproteobacteria bacterium]|nr:magnesium/cobalt transporter CorA [Deltaproteobacteria bacterium]